jgi:hypothetical protein
MRVILGDDTKHDLMEFFVKTMDYSEAESEEKIKILEGYIQAPFMEKAPIVQGDDGQQINHKSNSREPIRDVIEKLQRIEKLADELSLEINKLDEETHYRISDLVGYTVCSEYKISGENGYRSITPSFFTKIIAKASQSIHRDYKTAYKDKYTKLIDDLLQYWCINIDKKIPPKNRGANFIQFLAYVFGCEKEAAFKQYKNYRDSGMNLPIVL